MKRLLFSITTLTFCISALGQNQINADGLRTGSWFVIETDTVYHSIIGEKSIKEDTLVYQVRILEGRYLDGMKQGKWISRYTDYNFHPNSDHGTIMSVFQFKNDSLVGDFVVYHRNGKVMYQGYYTPGEKMTLAQYSNNPENELLGRMPVDVLYLLEKWSNLDKLE